jgi:hypothetical protein
MWCADQMGRKRQYALPVTQVRSRKSGSTRTMILGPGVRRDEGGDQVGQCISELANQRW